MNGSLHDTLASARARIGVPAIGAALVDPDDVLDLAVVGTRLRGRPEPAAEDDRWHIGSCGKAITAALYARLVEQGQAAWGTPIPTLFPDLAPQIDRGWSAATIDEIFLCRSGLPADLSRSELDAAYTDHRPLPEQRTQTAAQALSQPPRNRGRFRYSNLGYIVAGAAIERVTGMPFEDTVATHVLHPLGITTAGFGAPQTVWGHGPRLQVRGLCLGAGKPVAPDDPRGDNPAVLGPAGRLHLSLADWARFIQVFLRDGAPLLTPPSVAHLLEVPDGGRQTMAMGWAPAQLEGAALGMQGSNTMWVATALLSGDHTRASLVVTNDGRTRNLLRTAKLAAAILTDHR